MSGQRAGPNCAGELLPRLDRHGFARLQQRRYRRHGFWRRGERAHLIERGRSLRRLDRFSPFVPFQEEERPFGCRE